MPKVSEAHCDARRTQILLAACICMAERGFRQTSMREICQRSGLSPGAVYSYFRGKEAILRTLAEEGLQHSTSLLEDLEAAREVLPAIRRTVQFLRECDRTSEKAAAGRLDVNRLKVGLWAEAVQAPEIGRMFEKQSEAFMKRMTALVRRGQRSGEVRRGLDAESVARLIASLWEGLTLQRALEPAMDADRYFEAMFALLDGTLWAGRRKVRKGAKKK